MNVNREAWEEYLTDVREILPSGFENDCVYELLAEKTGAYIFNAFMTDVSAQDCADTLVYKLGEEE